MRILMLAWRYPLPSQSFVVGQVEGLRARGHDVEVVAFAAAPAVPDGRLRRARSAAACLARAALRRPGVALRWLPTGDLRTLHRAQPLLPVAPADVVHAQFGTQGLTALALRRLGLLRAPLVVSFRGHDVSRVVRQDGPEVYAGLFREADRLLANCDFFARRLLDLGAPGERLEVLRSGIDLDRFPYRPRPPRSHGARLLSVGRLVEKKGLQDGLRAVADLHRRRPGVVGRYTLVGDGPLAERLDRLAGELGIAALVRRTGTLPHSAVADEIAAADVLMAPSVTAGDGDQDAPVNVLKEAMAVGRAVVATRHGGIPELVEDGVHGSLVPERDPAALAAAVAALLRSPETAAARLDAARARIERQYDRRRLDDRLEEIYRPLVSRLPPQAKAGVPQEERRNART